MPTAPPRISERRYADLANEEDVLIRRRNFFGAAAAFFLILMVVTMVLDALTTVNEDRSFHAGATPRVVIRDAVGRGLRGGLEVRAGGADRIRVEGKVHATWRVHYVLEQRGEDVVIEVEPRPLIGWLGLLGPARFVVTAPAATRLDIETSRAPIKIQGVTGGGVLRTTNGPVHLVGAGGQLTAATTNGPIAMDGFDGTAELRSTNGPIDVQGSRGTFDVQTTNGGIAVRLRGEPNLRIDAQSTNGPVTTRRPITDSHGNGHTLSGSIGPGDGELSLRATNGPITIE